LRRTPMMRNWQPSVCTVRASESWIVTLTAGEIEAEHYQQMGLDGVEASRLKGSLRAWDSVSVPFGVVFPRTLRPVGVFLPATARHAKRAK
jgi:hypothetical protein